MHCETAKSLRPTEHPRKVVLAMSPRHRKSTHSLWLSCPGSQLPLILCLLFSREHTVSFFPWMQCTDLLSPLFTLCSLHSQVLFNSVPQNWAKKYLFWKVYFLILSGVLFGKTTEWYRHVMLGPQFPLQALTVLGQPFSYSCLNQITLGGRVPYCAWQGVY